MLMKMHILLMKRKTCRTIILVINSTVFRIKAYLLKWNLVTVLIKRISHVACMKNLLSLFDKAGIPAI